MKTIYTLILLSFILLTSCKKNRQCTCGSAQLPQLEIVSVTFHDTKKNAENKCNAREKELQENSYDVSCKLK